MAMAVAPCLAMAMVLTFLVGVSSSTMAPALIWSNLGCDSPKRVDYQISSPQTVADNAIQHFNQLCFDADENHPNMLVAFVGSEVRSMDLSNEFSSDTVGFLKNAISSSKSSQSFPYVNSKDGTSISNELLNTLQKNLLVKSMAFGCPGGRSLTSLGDEDYASDAKIRGLMVVCLPPGSEGKTIAKVLSTLESSAVGYVALYASDPFPVLNHHGFSHRLLQETNGSSSSNTSSPSGNGTDATYCNEVCRTKATVLEAIFVTIVLLMILISGLCCMMGIQTPIRYDKPHDT